MNLDKIKLKMILLSIKIIHLYKAKMKVINKLNKILKVKLRLFNPSNKLNMMKNKKIKKKILLILLMM
jgi:hypothetical protein